MTGDSGQVAGEKETLEEKKMCAGCGKMTRRGSLCRKCLKTAMRKGKDSWPKGGSYDR